MIAAFGPCDAKRISVRSDGTCVQLRLISPRMPFRNSAALRITRGTGIGLWVGRQLLEKRGGIHSSPSSTQFPLNGTTVFVHIPFQT